jgi:SpoVK/Ycf46/Vps4 family AAA+-type ATPase
MNGLRESILRQELQKELEEAKLLESRGKGREAGVHYQKAADISRRLAVISPRDHSKSLSESAEHYESLGEALTDSKTSDREKSDEIMKSMVVSERPKTKWEDIGGLEEAKKTIKEAIIMPFIKNKPKYVDSPRVILLYGPPGTGKTMLAKAASNMLNAAFFEARASTLLSKYFGESTKIISMLFSEARKVQPSVIFMDEFDSIMISRDNDPSESSRRVIGQLLQEIEGFTTNEENKVILIAATNKPWDLDDAMISRFQRKIYIPLPDPAARKSVFEIHLRGACLEDTTTAKLSEMTEGFSGRDIANLCREAVMSMIRKENPGLDDLTKTDIARYDLKHRPMTSMDFDLAFRKIKRTVEKAAVQRYVSWGEEMGM